MWMDFQGRTPTAQWLRLRTERTLASLGIYGNKVSGYQTDRIHALAS
uniref:Uncharacterized protein n=1 Tax=Anguilla anguilla TaxID=7936 RepID=A0A0E9S599_ANGAN